MTSTYLGGQIDGGFYIGAKNPPIRQNKFSANISSFTVGESGCGNLSKKHCSQSITRHNNVYVLCLSHMFPLQRFLFLLNKCMRKRQGFRVIASNRPKDAAIRQYML